MDVGANPAQEEQLVSGLNWSLKNVASSILSSEKATFFSSPGEFRPESSRLVKIALADSSRWANLATLQIALELHNPEPHPLELLCQPIGIFDSYRLMSQGTTLYETTDVARLSTTLAQLQGKEAAVYKAEKALPYFHGNFNKLVPNADGRLFLTSGNNFDIASGMDEQVYNQLLSSRPVISDIEVERFIVLQPGETKTLVFSPLCPICQSGLMWPLPHCSLEFLFMLQPNAANICAGTTVGNPSATNPSPSHSGQTRSQSWFVTLPRIMLDLVKQLMKTFYTF